MVAITYIEHNGTRHRVEVDAGMNLMESATLNMVPGVDGQCGGICSCATCHCYVPDAWRERVGSAGDGEKQMLEFAKHSRANSRLGCQVVVSEAMDGIEIQLPAEQGGIGD
jgi:2Fe-2S ferredoxin